jgi:predicted Zn-dependent peptidase
VALGVWVKRSSVHERRDEMGVSHFLEHLVFKGTEHRSAKEIALSLESLGGSLDAFTSREHTSFQARVLDEHLPQAADVLCDLIFRPTLRESDLLLERNVVLEEIAMVEDTPDDLVFELHNEALWGSHPYGYAILGTRETIGALPVEAVRALHWSAYRRCPVERPKRPSFRLQSPRHRSAVTSIVTAIRRTSCSGVRQSPTRIHCDTPCRSWA